MIENPKFWRWARITIRGKNYKELLKSCRANIVQEINISAYSSCGKENIVNILKCLFTAIVSGISNLLRLQVNRLYSYDIEEMVNLRSLDPELLSQALVRLEECSFAGCQPFSFSQIAAIYKTIGQSKDLKLKTLGLPNRVYSEVPLDMLVSIVGNKGMCQKHP